MAALEQQIVEQAESIAVLAESMANGALVGPRYSAVLRMVDMVDTLKAWTPDDRGIAGDPIQTSALV